MDTARLLTPGQTRAKTPTHLVMEGIEGSSPKESKQGRRFFVAQRRFLSAACKWVFGVGKLRDVLNPRPSIASPTAASARQSRPFLMDERAAEAWRSVSDHYASLPFHATKRSASSIEVGSPTKRRKSGDAVVAFSPVHSSHASKAAFVPITSGASARSRQPEQGSKHASNARPTQRSKKLRIVA